MNACEAAAMLAASVQRYEPKGSGVTNDIERVGCQEIAFGLAGADKLGSLLVRVKWGGDLSSLSPLYRQLYELILARSVTHHWGVRRLDHIGGIILLALVEQEVIRVDWHHGKPMLTHGARKCPNCKGTKYRFSRRYAKWFACKSCSASGQYLIHETKRAADAGMSIKSWQRYWKRRFLKLRAFLGRVEGRALRSLRLRSLLDEDSIQQIQELNRLFAESKSARKIAVPAMPDVQITKIQRPILRLPEKARTR